MRWKHFQWIQSRHVWFTSTHRSTSALMCSAHIAIVTTSNTLCTGSPKHAHELLCCIHVDSIVRGGGVLAFVLDKFSAQKIALEAIVVSKRSTQWERHNWVAIIGSARSSDNEPRWATKCFASHRIFSGVCDSELWYTFLLLYVHTSPMQNDRCAITQRLGEIRTLS